MGFNTYGSRTKQIGGDSKVIWRKVNSKIQSGGTIDLSSYNVGDIIPAGTAVVQETVGGEITLYKGGTLDAKQAYMVGFTENDICKEEGDTIGTCAIVTDGELYVNRLADDEAIKVALLLKTAYAPGIKLIVEGELPSME